MKLEVISSLLLALSSAQAFAPAPKFGVQTRATTFQTARSFGVDPSVFQDVPQHLDNFREAFTSLTLSDALDSVASDAAGAAADAAAQGSKNGWFGFLVGPIQGLLGLIHSAMVAVGVKENAWGISIILLTLLIKVLTFPLTKTQLESTNKMQALQPTIKGIQAKYESNPEVMNQKIAEVYQTNEVNPLAGCLPSLAQIPVFIGLYRSVLNLAAENALDEPFLFLPSLEGPTYGADPTKGSDWLFANWQNGAPSLGWDDTTAFLILPVLLVISQFASMQLMQPKTEDPQQQQANVILKVLPLMIGWFSLNVPSALCIYWFINNIITTATTLFIRSNMEPIAAVSGGGAATAEPPVSSVFAPPPIRDRPAGFASSISDSFDDDDVKPLTKPIDAEIVTEEKTVETSEESGTGIEASSSAPKQKKRGKKKKKRRN